MDRLGDSGLRGCGRLAMATGLVRSIGNLKFGPEVGVGRIKSDASVVDIWHAQMRSMAGDLHAVSNGSGARADVLGADAREYPRGVYKVDDDDLAVRTRADIADIADEIERRRVAMGKTSGFERMYARVVKLYFGGMARHLASLRSVLRPGARLAYVVGDQASYLRVMIRTGQLLASIAQSLGYEVTDIDLFRTRLATATREQLREEVLLLRWPGTAGRGASLGS